MPTPRLPPLSWGWLNWRAAKARARIARSATPWVDLMLFVAISSFFIHELRQWGNFGLIHLLSIFTLAMLPLGIYFARQHNVVGHRKTMLGLFFGALVIAGAPFCPVAFWAE